MRKMFLFLVLVIIIILNNFSKNKCKKKLMQKFESMINKYQSDKSKDKVNERIIKLPEQHRIIYRMSRNRGLSNKEISGKLNVSSRTVRQQISESLKFICKSL